MFHTKATQFAIAPEVIRTTTCSWSIPRNVPANKDWMHHSTIPALVIDNCDVSLWLRLVDVVFGGSSCLQVSLRKTKIRPIKVIIKLTLNPGDNSLERSIDDWSECVEFSFPNVPRSSINQFSGLRLDCNIAWFLKEQDTFKSPAVFPLHEGFGKYHLSNEFSDVKIVIGKEEIPAHTIILSACSSVLSTKITAAKREKNDNQLVIDDVSVNVMKTVLEFMYKGDITGIDDVDSALEILDAAEKYNIQRLKEICEYKLYKYLRVDNVLEIYRKADTLQALRLKEECLNFIYINRKKVIEDEFLEEFCRDKHHLMCDIMRKIIKEQL
uniref:BTB domain-containing protein n=1 Tax=Bracon brevicornis TaxID=1563983 RepID=A0A6V7M155_9HYME